MRNLFFLNIKPLFITLTILLCSNLRAQDTTSVEIIKIRKHELKFDAFEALITPAAELNYEYLINHTQSLGGSVYKSFNSSTDNTYQDNFTLVFFYRKYLYSLQPKLHNTGIYLEALTQFAVGEQYRFINLTDTEQLTDWSNFGLGLTTGYKWFSISNFVVEIHLGGGIYTFNTKNSPKAFFRGGILAGYRF